MKYMIIKIFVAYREGSLLYPRLLKIQKHTIIAKLVEYNSNFKKVEVVIWPRMLLILCSLRYQIT